MTVRGSAEIGTGAILVAIVLLYVIFDLECSALLGCFFTFPTFLVGFDAIFLSLVILLLGLMLVAAGAVRRARSRLPSYIV